MNSSSFPWLNFSGTVINFLKKKISDFSCFFLLLFQSVGGGEWVVPYPSFLPSGQMKNQPKQKDKGLNKENLRELRQFLLSLLLSLFPPLLPPFFLRFLGFSIIYFHTWLIILVEQRDK